ncbi:MAG: ABC transporter substrate-binding protein [Paludibacteraceae bacterium]|nr:ABC transporter substrate-binding protein [Paludibacteraceae bacterium]
MKKILFFLATIVAFSATAADREHTLKIYNWADYIDMQNVLDKFPEWYREQTGEEVQVSYQTFDINESMLTQIEIGKEDYDVVCPSEYIVERMLRNGLLQKINKDFGDTPDYTQLVAPFVLDKFQQMAPKGSDIQVSDYAVGYMGGTTGWLYNPQWVSAEELQSWDAIFNPKFEGKIFMKDAFRDVYSVIILYAYRDEIASGEVDMDELVANITPERIARVEEILNKAKNNIAGWEVDFGKEEMAKGKTWMNLSWSGDAQWAIQEAAEIGLKLNYIVPKEGSNVWFDGWVIPKYAVNTKAAAYFINFMCRPDNAIFNMEEIGYVSVIASPEILEWAQDEEAYPEAVDASYFFGEGTEAVHVNPVQYPDKSVIERCALMHDCGEQTEQMLDMWNRVKGDNLSSGMLWIVGIVVLLLIAFIIIRIINANKLHQTKNKKRKI